MVRRIVRALPCDRGKGASIIVPTLSHEPASFNGAMRVFQTRVRVWMGVGEGISDESIGVEDMEASGRRC
jgi:hypothetical protein